MDLTWLCFVAVILLLIPVIYYGVTSRLKYAKQLLTGRQKRTSAPSNPENMKARTRFTGLDEFYQAIRVLIEWLRKEGYSGEAIKLDRAMHVAGTGSEVLGEIMLALKSMQGDYSPKLKKEINECFQFALNHRKILGLDGSR